MLRITLLRILVELTDAHLTQLRQTKTVDVPAAGDIISITRFNGSFGINSLDHGKEVITSDSEAGKALIQHLDQHK